MKSSLQRWRRAKLHVLEHPEAYIDRGPQGHGPRSDDNNIGYQETAAVYMKVARGIAQC